MKNNLKLVLAIIILISFGFLYFLYSNWETRDGEEGQNTPETNSSIRDYDFSKMFPILNYGDKLDVQYADMNADGDEEALITYCMGNSCGGITYYIMGMNEDQPEELYMGSASRTEIKIEENAVVYETFDESLPINQNKSYADMTFDKKHFIYFNGEKFVERTESLLN